MHWWFLLQATLKTKMSYGVWDVYACQMCVHPRHMCVHVSVALLHRCCGLSQIPSRNRWCSIINYSTTSRASSSHPSVQGALPHILKQLQLSPYDDTTEAAADVLRAACQGNEANKAAVRKDWGIPLLVLLIGPTAPKGLVERAVDCLRILTTNSDENRGALIECNSALPYLLSLMEDESAAEVCGRWYNAGWYRVEVQTMGKHQCICFVSPYITYIIPSQVTMERTAAVIANLTSMMDTFASLRESGIVQKLVKLLEHGPESKITHHAVVAIANLVQDQHTAKSVRLAGGVPPLLQLVCSIIHAVCVCMSQW